MPSRQRTVLITGASRGLGLELTRLYAQRGWTTFPLVRRGEDAAAFLRADFQDCHPIVADVTHDDADAAVRDVLTPHAPALDVLINNAGFAGTTYTVDELTVDEVRTLMDVHCLGVVRITKAALPWLRKSDRSRIVNVTSRLGSTARNASGEFVGKPFTYAYRLAKAAQNMFTLCLHQELSGSGVCVFALHPGELLTDTGSYDARTTADEAAQRIADLIERADASHSGQCFDAITGQVIPW